MPDYQRPYSWTAKEADQLLDDVILARSEASAADSEVDGGYFLGTMLLMRRSPMHNAGGSGPDGRQVPPSAQECDIVDGQQRAITLTILLAVLRDLTAERGGEPDAGLAAALWRPTSLDGEPLPRIRLRSREADFFRKFVLDGGASGNMPPDDEQSPAEARILAVRERFVGGLVDLDTPRLLELTEFVLDSCFLAVITTTNIDRAHHIFTVLNNRGRPLARNDILKAQILGGFPEAERGAYVPAWERIEQRLGGDFEILFSHIRAIAGQHTDRVVSGIGHLIADAGGPKPFFDETLTTYAAIYEEMQMRPTGAVGAQQTLTQNLSYLSWLGGQDWMPAMMLFWRQSAGDPEQLADFSTRLDRLAYGMRLLGFGSDKRQARFKTALASVRDGSWRDPVASPFEITKDEMRNIQYNLRSLHSRSQLTCKLVLLRLNDVIAGAPQNLDPAEYTVEHVLPQKPGRLSLWRTWFPSADERESCTQSLGNLVLVTRAQNDRARNMELSRKLEVYFADGEDRALAITRELAGIAEWRADAVIERERRLLALINRLWGVETVRGDSGTRSPMERPRRRSAG